MEELSLFLIAILVILNIVNLSEAAISCKDENGKFVDWFYAYKLPKHDDLKHPSGTGMNYLYITSDSEKDDWTLSDKLADDSNSIMGNTLWDIYENEDNLVLMYNDEPPTKKQPPDGTHGHTKGVVVADENGGYWLIHSVPKYPPELGENYDYPKTGTIYGQSFLCISLEKDQMDKVGKQLQYNEPHIYSSNIPEPMKGFYSELEKAQETKFITEPPFNNVEYLISSGGVNFTSFAKSRNFKKELYDDWVAPTLDDDVYVETWRHGKGNINSDCRKHAKVYNIKGIGSDEYPIGFKTLEDHSKWLVSSENKDWICVGDINRQEHQKVRGGGTVCQESTAISKIYRDLIKSVEPCPKQWNF